MIYYPHSTDKMWNAEIESILGYCNGNGMDVGCGHRTIDRHIITVDHLPDDEENDDIDYHLEGDKLPFVDGQFDYLISIHSIEHFENTIETLKEWCRVVKRGGFINLVVPDKNFIPRIGSGNEDLTHKHDFNSDVFLAICKMLPQAVVHNWDFTACPNWSFKIILRKI